METLNELNVTEVDVADFDGKYSPAWTNFFTLSTLVIIIFGICVQKSLFKLLQRRRGRGINRIIIAQQVGLSLSYVYLLVSLLPMYVYPMKEIVGTWGCQVYDFFEIYIGVAVQFSSFFTSLFRYLCIVHDSMLFQLGFTPVSLANTLMLSQFSLPAYIYAAVRFAGTPTPGNQRTPLLCLGRFNEVFDSVSGAYFCHDLGHWTPRWIICNSGIAFYIVLSSNVIEAFMFWRSVQLIKTQTRSVKSLLSLTAFDNRQREESIMITVNIWQYINETVTSVVIAIYFWGSLVLYDNVAADDISHKAIFIFFTSSHTILNSFYLLGDNSFHRSATREGIFIALMRAFQQNYE